jgi:hypothetical protein
MDHGSAKAFDADELLIDDLMQIRELNREWSRRAHERREVLHERARAEFASVSGWHVARTKFSFHSLIAAKPHHWCFGCSRDPLHCAVPFDPHRDDHPEYFRSPTRPCRPTAISAHLYADDSIVEEARQWAIAHRLLLHEPPNLQASWYYPGRTRLVVYTRPEVILKWPSFAK